MDEYHVNEIVTPPELPGTDRAALLCRSEFMSTWLRRLFWVAIAGNVVSLLAIDAFAGTLVYTLGTALGKLCSVTMAAILIRLGSEHPGYRTAGWCALAAMVIDSLGELLTRGDASGDLSLLFTLSAAVLGLVGTYREYMAHGEMLWEVDLVLSKKWKQLWKWYIGSFGICLGSVLLVILFLPLGIMVLIGGALAVLAVGILKLVYLWQSAKAFEALMRT